MTKTSQEKTSSEIAEWESADGLKLKYRVWRGKPDGERVVFLHGIESHSEWFSDCAEEIAKSGANVYAPDRRGSGLNEKDRGDSPGNLQLIDDVARFAESIKGSHAALHLAALSWGAKLAVATDMLHPSLFRTLTLIAPGFFPLVSPRILKKVAIAFDALFRPSRSHGIPIRDEMFTSGAESLEYIAADPLRLRRVTARFYLENAKLDRSLRKRGRQWTAPTQLLMAERDEIVDNRRLREMFERLRTEPKKVRMYAGCKHSLQFERPGEVAKDIVDWMRAAPRD
jgi:alpha-beta hydrolase superfamily lysophospholipase